MKLKALNRDFTGLKNADPAQTKQCQVYSNCHSVIGQIFQQ